MTVGEGSRVGDRYVLRGLLGRGGMADVYEATDEVLHRQVAVKVLRYTADDPSSTARFTAEGRTLAKLHHPSLVTVLDAGTEGDLQFLVLQLVDGLTLAELTRRERLPLERVGQIGAEVAGALAVVHENGVVHRDVKPGNVLLAKDGRALLADFGIARLLADATRHTRTGLTLGTVAYVSPEQVRGEAVTPSSDIYSLGLVLIEAITGRPVYEGTDLEAALPRVHSAPPVPDDLPAAWRDVLGAMTRLDPADRPGAAEVAAALSTALSTRVLAPTQPVPDTGTRVLPQPPVPASPGHVTTKDRPWKVLLGVVAALLVLGVGVVLVRGDDPGAEAGSEVPEGVPAQLQEPLADLHDAVEGER